MPQSAKRKRVADYVEAAPVRAGPIGEDPEKFKAFVNAAEARKNEARA